MKKKYEKPLIAVESFQLDAAIAGPCAEGNILNYSIEDCTVAVGGENYFADAPCTVDVVMAGGVKCYQATTATYLTELFLHS